MIFHKMFLYAVALSCLIFQAHAMPAMLVDSNDLDWVGNSPGDPLDPSFVGESMSMPLPIELIQKAKKSGIIKESNHLYNYIREPSEYMYLGTPPADAELADHAEAGAPAPYALAVNATGPWSLDMSDLVDRHLDMSLIQNEDSIMGYGIMSSDNNTQRVTVSGSHSGGRISLTVMSMGRLDLFRLDLSPGVHSTGTYTAYSADGKTWSGDVMGVAPG